MNSKIYFVILFLIGASAKAQPPTLSSHHKGGVNTVAYSITGKYYASGSAAGDVIICNALTQEVVNRFEVFNQIIYDLSFGPNDLLLISNSGRTKLHYLYGDREEIREKESKFSFAARPSPNGHYLLTTNYRDNIAHVWNSRSKKKIAELSGHTKAIRAAAFSPDNKYILTGAEDHTLRLWDGTDFKQLADPFEGHQGAIEDVVFNPSSQYFYSCSKDSSIRTWDAVNRIIIDTLLGHRGAVTSLAISPNGKYLFSASLDSSILLWQLGTGQFSKITQLKQPIYDLAFNPHSSQLLLGTPNLIPSILEVDPLCWKIHSIEAEEEGLNSTRIWNKEKYKVRFKINSELPLKFPDFALSLNGKPVQAKGEVGKPLKKVGNYYFYEKSIELDPGKNSIRLHTASGCLSSPPISIVYSTDPSKSILPSLHMLAVGPQHNNLLYTDKDARDIAAVFLKQQELPPEQALFDSIFVHTLIGPQASRAGIGRWIEYYGHGNGAGHISNDDIFILFISTHGLLLGDPDNQKLRLLPTDHDPQAPITSSIPYDDLKLALQKINCTKIVFIDACHSGGAKGQKAPEMNRQRNEEILNTDFITISSSQEGQVSYENEAWENGAFTEALLEGLSGKADYGEKDGVISLQELIDYIGVSVASKVFDEYREFQTPIVSNKNKINLDNIRLFKTKGLLNLLDTSTSPVVKLSSKKK